MPHYKYSKILSKEIMDIINDYILPNKLISILKYDECLIELKVYFIKKIKKQFLLSNKMVEIMGINRFQGYIILEDLMLDYEFNY